MSFHLMPAGRPSWSTASVSVPAAAPDVEHEVTVGLPGVYLVTGVSSNVPARVRLYATAGDRDTDAARPVIEDPAHGVGLVVEYVTAAGDTGYPVVPPVVGVEEGAESGGGTGVPALVSHSEAGDTELSVTISYLLLGGDA